MKTIKTAVLCSGGGTNLQAIIDAHARGELPHVELSLVVGSKDGIYSLERAAKAGIPAAVVARKAYTCAADFEKALVALLEEHDIEVIVLAGFLTVLSEDFVRRYPERILNVHPSLIPSFCGDGFYGLRVHEAALEKGVKVTGATVHYVNEVPDGGKIILQKAVDIEENDTPESLQLRVMQQAEWKILPQAAEIVAARIAKEKQA